MKKLKEFTCFIMGHEEFSDVGTENATWCRRCDAEMSQYGQQVPVNNTLNVKWRWYLLSQSLVRRWQVVKSITKPLDDTTPF